MDHEVKKPATSFIWILPLLLALLVNFNVLQNGFVWDDNFLIARFMSVENDSTSIYSLGKRQTYYRPLISWTYQTEWNLWKDRPLGYHISVWLAHGLVTLLIFLCGRGLLRAYKLDESAALLAATLFAVHPAHSEAVAWISGRHDIFMAFFALLAFWALLRHKQGNHPAWTVPLFGIAAALALASKETALPFIAFLVLLNGSMHRQEGLVQFFLKSPITWIGVALTTIYLLVRVKGLGAVLGGASQTLMW